jgi:hypothetical protein
MTVTVSIFRNCYHYSNSYNYHLQSMGFQRGDAQRALDMAGGSLNGAMQLLTT